MEEFSEVFGISSEFLASRFMFLSARAQWHQDQRSRLAGLSAMNVACAATLQRDAGAIALMLGRVQDARLAFRAAGHLRLQLGFYDGFYLSRLGNIGSEEGSSALGDAPTWLERSILGGERERGGLPPFAATASRSPRQLVSVLQAADTLNTYFKGAVEAALERLKIYSAYLLGVTQTPLEKYLDLFFELQGGQLSSSRKTLIGMSVKRTELIAAAQRDQFHWRLAQKPAELIDMDLLSLGLTALERGGDVFEQMLDVAAQFGLLAIVPLDAARLLTAKPPEETPLRSTPL